MPKETAQALLERSVPDPRDGSSKRYAVHDGRGYCAVKTDDETYHGWPVGFLEVPPQIWQQWITEGQIYRSDVQRNWRLG
jgi:hypothetical protein